ncbi:MAG: hypothetical protein RLZZ262_1078 [Bacteroidota bacterium]|jgi:hypothetical protein
MSEKKGLQLPFKKINYLLLIAGVVTIIIGYLLMSGGGSQDPNVFNGEELFSTRRITIAPLVVLIGYLIIGVGIMYRPKK